MAEPRAFCTGRYPACVGYGRFESRDCSGVVLSAVAVKRQQAQATYATKHGPGERIVLPGSRVLSKCRNPNYRRLNAAGRVVDQAAGLVWPPTPAPDDNTV